MNLNNVNNLQPILERNFTPKIKMTSDGIQYVKEIPTSEGWVFLDSAFNDEAINPGLENNVLSLRGNREFFGKQTDKQAVTFISYDIDLLNVNERNNRVEFLSSNTGAIVYSVNIIPGRYNTATALMDALVLALNTLTGATGLTFSYLVNPDVGGVIINISDSYRLNTTGGTYKFVLSSTHTCMNNGTYLYNLPRSQGLSASKNVGRVLGHYTRYIDFVSNSINEEQRVPSTEPGLRSGNNLLLRLFLPTLERRDTASDAGLAQVEHLRWVRKDRSKSIRTIDIDIFDEFGLPLYTLKYDDDTPVSDWYDIVMIAR